jgi:large subunit ribosomal protein L24
MRRTKNTNPKLHIRKDDLVLILSGDDKGKKGRILEVFPKENRAIVEGANMITRHTKPNAQFPEGGRIQKEAPLHISNLMVVEPKSGLPSRIGKTTNEKGKKVRITKRSNEVL